MFSIYYLSIISFIHLKEGEYNITVIAKNSLDVEAKLILGFEIVGKVRGIKIDDFQIITTKKQTKDFEISFESVGAGTCVVVDFKDGSLRTFGDEIYCQEWQPDVRYDPTFVALGSSQTLSHVF